MDDATGLAEALLGLDGFRVLEVSESPDEVCISVETTVTWSVAPAVACGHWPRNAGASTSGICLVSDGRPG